MTDREIVDLWRQHKEVMSFARELLAFEREECARLCESLPLEWSDQPDIAQAERATMLECAAAIRAMRPQ